MAISKPWVDLISIKLKEFQKSENLTFTIYNQINVNDQKIQINEERDINMDTYQEKKAVYKEKTGKNSKNKKVDMLSIS